MLPERMKFHGVHVRRVGRRVGDYFFVQRSTESLLRALVLSWTAIGYATRWGLAPDLFASQERVAFLLAAVLGVVWIPVAILDAAAQRALAKRVIDTPSLVGAELQGQRLHRIELHGRDLHGAFLAHADLSRSNLAESDLSGTNMTGAVLTGARLDGAKLHHAMLRSATLNRAVLTDAELAGASLGGSSLRFADLSNANLDGCDLSFADLRGADLRHAELRNANLTMADLSGALVDGASFVTAQLDGARLHGISGSSAASMPPAYPWLGMQHPRPVLALLRTRRSLADAFVFGPMLARRAAMAGTIALIASVVFLGGSSESEQTNVPVAVSGTQADKVLIAAFGRTGPVKVTTEGFRAEETPKAVPFGELIELTASRTHARHVRFAATTSSAAGPLTCEIRVAGVVARSVTVPAGTKTVVCEAFIE